MTRLPLRAVPQDQLRAAHSAGRTFYEYEGLPPRGFEKPLEEQSLSDMLGGRNVADVVTALRRGERLNYGEALSESRRSFLTTRQGALSLDAPASVGGVVELINFIADDGPKCLIDYIDDGLDLEELDDLEQAEHDARRFDRWMYTTQDFVTGRQILWEQEQSQHGPSYTLQVKPTPDGKLTIDNVGRGILPGHDFNKIALSAISAIFRTIGGRASSLDELHARLDLVREALDDPRVFAYRDPDDREERERAALLDDELAHSSYDEATDPDWWDTDKTPVITRHRSPRRNIDWETWHHDMSRITAGATELGMDLCTDAETESLLGPVAFDDNGNLLDEKRAALLASQEASAA